MADTRIGSSAEPRLPISTELSETESVASSSTPSPSAVSVDPQQTARTAEAFKRGAGESIGQNNLRGNLLRQGLDQQLISNPSTRNAAGTPPLLGYSAHPPQTGGPQQSKAGGAQPLSGTTLAQRNEEQQTRGLQTQLNRWRAANGEPQIPVSGQNDQNTKDAIRDFQTKTGLPVDGIAGPKTHERMSLMLDIEKRMAGKPHQAANLHTIAGSPAFRSMPEPMQAQMLKNIRSYAGHSSSAIAGLTTLAIRPNFEILPAANKQVLLESFYQHPYPRQVGLVTRAADSILFQFISPDRQSEALRHLSNFPNNPDQFDNVVSLQNDAGFRALDPDIRDQILEGLPKRFQPGQLDIATNPNNIPNLITMASQPDFAQVLPEARDVMLDVLSNRPDNAQLAAALAQLSQDPRFQRDHRNYRGAVYNVDASVP